MSINRFQAIHSPPNVSHLPALQDRRAVQKNRAIQFQKASPEEIALQTAKPADVDKVKQLSWKTFYANKALPKPKTCMELVLNLFKLHQWVRQWVNQYLTKRVMHVYSNAVLAHPQGQINLAKNGSDVVGCVFLSPFALGDWKGKNFNGQGWITDFAIDEQWRGKGLGKKLLQKTLADARRLGYKRIFLDTDNPVAKDLYIKHGGFVPCDINDTWMAPHIKKYKLREQFQDTVYLVKNLE